LQSAEAVFALHRRLQIQGKLNRVAILGGKIRKKNRKEERIKIEFMG
jgi:hypothetical protein